MPAYTLLMSSRPEPISDWEGALFSERCHETPGVLHGLDLEDELRDFARLVGKPLEVGPDASEQFRRCAAFGQCVVDNGERVPRFALHVFRRENHHDSVARCGDASRLSKDQASLSPGESRQCAVVRQPELCQLRSDELEPACALAIPAAG